MDIKLEQWEPNKDASKPSLLGHARVGLAEKMFVWMTVMQGNKGIFVKFPSVRLHGDFHPALGWPGQNIEQKIREAIMPEIAKRTDPGF